MKCIEMRRKTWFGSTLVLILALFCIALQTRAQTEGFVGVWDGTAGDPRVDEQWRITHVEGKWAVFGFYYWNAKAVEEDHTRTAGDEAGKFKGENVRIEDGTLKFTQKFDPKPISSWADNVEIEATVNGNTITFKNKFVKDVKLKRAKH